MKRTHQRFLSLLLALVMVLGLMPMGTLAFAAEAAEVIDVEVYVDRQQTVTLEGSVIPDASGVEGIAAVTYETANMAAIGSTNASRRLRKRWWVLFICSSFLPECSRCLPRLCPPGSGSGALWL